ncbi:MAG: PAS domain-containing sensor histidine kinase [Promethearchaeota archaeon]|nr:MAG: PAS domain-containing sensor histidine kinase [Candidatus Lokiarchaeota archaeon]
MEKLEQEIERDKYRKLSLTNSNENLELEEDIKKLKIKYDFLFKSSTSGIAFHKIVYDAKGYPINYVITDVNPQYEKILSIKREDVINKTATEVYNVEQAPYLELYSKVAETQESLSFETYFPPMDTYFKISARSPNKGEFITVFDDITESKVSEQKLIESEENYRQLFEDSPFAVALMDFNGIFLECNSSVERVFNYKKEELIGKNFITLKFVPKKFLPMVLNGFKTLSKEETPAPKEIQLYKKDRSLIWVLLHSSLVKLSNRNLIQVIVEDITDRKLADHKIIESEEKFRTITEQSFIGIAILQDFKFMYVNQQFTKTLGYSSNVILNWEPKEFFLHIHPEDRQMVKEIANEKYFNTNGVIANLQFRVIKKSGEIIWLEIISKTINYKGKLADLVATLDITEKIKAERIILEENKKLLELNKMRRDIIIRVSHELKTPLTSIYGASQILLKHLKEKLDDDVLNFVAILHRGALRLKKLVENLIDASRIETGKLELKISNQNISKLIRECVEEMSYLTNNRNQTINVIHPDAVYLNVDKIRLQQVITNLLSNAIKNTPKNGEIYVNIIEKQDYTDIQIRDNGIGITDEEKGLLFEKFGKIERYGMDLGVDIEGSGLGLYISKEIIDLHGGQILAESEGRHKGALFTVRLFKK